jgi:regulator of protease activity HflC (stomatin/prohibitin superfamily)
MEVVMVLAYIKIPATQYAIHFQQGLIRREGAGLSFFYYAPTSTIMAVPVVSTDAPFVFHENTADFQPVTIQGQITYRISDPKKAAALLDFSVDRFGRYAADGILKLQERLIQATQVAARARTQTLGLRQALTTATTLSSEVQASLKSSEDVAKLGVEVLNVSVLSVKPTPEIAKALEAEAREALQGRSDEAIYARRNAAVEQERRIRESELNTEIAVEEKKRQIRETQMAAEIAVEAQRTKLIDQRVENERKDADSRAYTLEAMMKPLRGMDWKKLMMMQKGGADPRQMIALAFEEMAVNAQKIGELNVSPDLLRSLIGPTATK